MMEWILGSVATVVVLYLIGRLASSVIKNEKLNQELKSKLEALEDRFYHPANYENAFFRPLTAKKKDDAKEG
jgi:uncharacterized membrane-anchored protein YhcB (DUF1043 family)